MDLVPENQTNENQVNKDEVQLNDNQVKLSDGRIVEFREAIGNDDMILAAELGKVYTADAAGYTIFQSCLTIKCIVKIEGQEIPKMKKFSEYRNFAGQFKKKDWDKIQKKFNEINNDPETPEAEGNELEGK